MEAEPYPEARNPSYRLLIDLGENSGIKKSIAQLTKNYFKEDLKSKRVLCVINFPPRQIGPAITEVLTLGIPDEKGDSLLLSRTG